MCWFVSKRRIISSNSNNDKSVPRSSYWNHYMGQLVLPHELMVPYNANIDNHGYSSFEEIMIGVVCAHNNGFQIMVPQKICITSAINKNDPFYNRDGLNIC